MALEEQVLTRSKEIATDAYSMSVGELISLYKDGELDIHPEFQRFFRWTPGQKSRFIESLLLGIPVPSFFVSQKRDGSWDVVDGLQRLSTIFQLTGDLRNEDNIPVAPLVLEKTTYLPDLKGKSWESDNPDSELPQSAKLKIKRARLDLKIVMNTSDESAKYELFQRLNTGGSLATAQEVRNCLLIMLNRSFYNWFAELGQDEQFRRVRLFFVEEFSPYSWAFLPADASLQCSFRGDSNQASAYPRLSGGQPSLETVPNTVGLSPSGALPSGHSRGVLVRFHGQGDRPVMAVTTGFQGRRFDVPEARTGVPRIDLPSPAPCAAADAVFADAKAFLSSNEARQMSESELERELHRRGQKLVRKLLQGHHDQRSPGQVAGPAEDASGVECSARREHDSHAETTSGTMPVVGLGCARRGHDGLHPLDAALNLLPERSLVDMRRGVTIATASRAPPRTPWKPQWYSTLSTWQRRCGVRCSSPSSLKACRHLARDRMVVDRRTVTLGCSCDGPQAATGRRRIDAY